MVSGLSRYTPNTKIIMIQTLDGEIYLGSNYKNSYGLIEYDWSGPQYTTITSKNKVGTHVTEGKTSKIGGSVLLGDVVVGALTAGSKKKKSINEHTTSVTEKVEVYTPANLKLKNLKTNEIVTIVIACNTLINTQIKCFNILENRTLSSSIDEVKKLKELLDMRIISSEEFELKKKQLLAL